MQSPDREERVSFGFLAWTGLPRLCDDRLQLGSCASAAHSSARLMNVCHFAIGTVAAVHML